MKKQLLFAALIAACAFGARQMKAEIEVLPPGELVEPPAEVCPPGDAVCSGPPRLIEPAAPASMAGVQCIPRPGVDCPALCDPRIGACVERPDPPPGDVPPTP